MMKWIISFREGERIRIFREKIEYIYRVLILINLKNRIFLKEN